MKQLFNKKNIIIIIFNLKNYSIFDKKNNNIIFYKNILIYY